MVLFERIFFTELVHNHAVLLYFLINEQSKDVAGRCLLVLTILGSAFGPARKRSRLTAVFGFAKFISSTAPLWSRRGEDAPD